MLILSRKIEQCITIGEQAEIKIYVLAVQGQSVRLGIDAPKHIPVHREEIFERIQQNEKNDNSNNNTIDE